MRDEEKCEVSHLVTDRLVLKPRFIQDFLQLPAIKVGHPNGLDQSCVLTLLHGLEMKEL